MDEMDEMDDNWGVLILAIGLISSPNLIPTWHQGVLFGEGMRST